ncbi:MAG: hypothetical protein ABIG03_02135 [Candidatus Eisenbacteria bacterium]
MNLRTWKRDPCGGPAPAALAAAVAIAFVLAAASAAFAQDELAVRISPDRAHTVPGGEIVFTATAYGAGGGVVAADVVWSVIPPRAGVVVGDGRFVAAQATGRAIVRAVAAYGGAVGAGHAVVEVGAEPPARLAVSIDPRSAAVGTGEALRFRAVVTDPVTGNAVDAAVRWVVVPDRMGTIDAEGLFTAGSEETAGRVAARATHDGREGVGDASVVVGSPPGAGARVSVVPPHAFLEPGEELAFDAVVTNAQGDPIEADVTWVVMPARLGVVSGSGLFTAGPDEGAGRVVATVSTTEGPARGFASLEIRNPGPAGVRVRVRPREAVVMTGGDVQFEATAFGPDGVPLDVPIDWAVRPNWIGSVDGNGLFTASEDMPEPSANGGWMGAVIASVETHAGLASDAARVIVRDGGPVLKFRVYPHSPVVAPGQDIQFEGTVIGAEDPIDWTTEWAVFPEDLGTITPDGLFTANPVYGDASSADFGPHEGVVAARAMLEDGSTLADRAHVRVRIPGHPVQVKVRPAFAVVPPGESMEFDALVLGPNGEEIALPVTWHVTPNHLGHVSAGGTFTAADLHVEPDSWQRPRGTIVAEVRVAGGKVFRGAAVVVIDLPDPEVTVRVSPKSVTLSEGDTFQFLAEAFTSDGTPIELDVEWRVSDTLIGDVDGGGLFTAATQVPQGHSRRTTVIVGGLYNGRVYWDFATVRLSGN